MNYDHTQKGGFVINVIFALLVFFGIILLSNDLSFLYIFLYIFLAFILFSFSSLRITIDQKELKIKYGNSIYSKTFDVKNIKEFKKVKNHWYYGWGIRIWFWPYMVIFNLSGYDAIELKMKNGKIYRIGSDDVDNFENALKLVKKN